MAGPQAASAAELDGFLSFITGNNEPNVRRVGATHLLENGSVEAVARLVDVLTNGKDLAAKLAVSDAVAEFRHPPVSLVAPLITALNDDTPELVSAALSALRGFDNGTVIEQLEAAALDTKSDMSRRTVAIRAMGELGGEIRAIAALTRIAGGGDATLRDAALAALRQATGEAFADAAAVAAWWENTKATSETDWLRQRNHRLYRRIGELDAVSGRLGTRLVDALRELHVRMPEAERPKLLLGFLRDPLAAVRGLGLDLINVRITDRKEVGAEIKAQLGKMIADPDVVVRGRVANVVGDLRLKKSGEVDTLLAALGQEQDPGVRQAQLKALAQLDDARAIPAAITHLNDPEPTVVAEAARALGALARPDHAPAESIAATAAALSKSFAEPAVREDSVREAFLTAMGQIGSAQFRDTFRAELAEDRSISIRQAAVRGLALIGDEAAAKDLCGLLTSREPRVRLAAADALGKCGRSEGELTKLAERLDASGEPDGSVRERAWSSYKAIAQRFPVDQHVTASDRFAGSADVTAQHRCLELLKEAEPKFGQLPEDRRSEAFERMARAHLALDEFKAAAGRFDQAAKLVPDRASERFGVLASQSVAALLRGGDDAEAIGRIKTIVGNSAAPVIPHGALLGKAVLDAVSARVDTSPESALTVMAAASPFAGRLGPTFGTQLEALRRRAEDRHTVMRDAEIDRLLKALATDPKAGTRLTALGRDAVLPRLHAALAARPTTTAPADPAETALIALGTQLATEWKGYAPGCPPAERIAALAALEALFKPAARPPAPATRATPPPTSQPASVPAGS
ncbi:MAG: HEAT repeat domain-containing protein [Phycisphaerae bacterium]